MIRSAMPPPFMRAVSVVFCVLLVGLLSNLSHANTRVDLELILAIDVSGSVDETEYDLQVEALAAAFRDPAILAAISRSGPHGIAVAIVQWSGRDEHEVVVGWQHLSSAKSIADYADRISLMKRRFWAGDTLLGRALNYSSRQFLNNGFTSDRRVIDVSGDGGVETLGVTANARNGLVAAGFVINGLAIETDVSNLKEFYIQNVIGGFGAFAMSARDYQDFRQAIRRKLVREIAPLQVSERREGTLKKCCQSR